MALDHLSHSLHPSRTALQKPSPVSHIKYNFCSWRQQEGWHLFIFKHLHACMEHFELEFIILIHSLQDCFQDWKQKTPEYFLMYLPCQSDFYACFWTGKPWERNKYREWCRVQPSGECCEHYCRKCNQKTLQQSYQMHPPRHKSPITDCYSKVFNNKGGIF